MESYSTNSNYRKKNEEKSMELTWNLPNNLLRIKHSIVFLHLISIITTSLAKIKNSGRFAPFSK